MQEQRHRGSGSGWMIGEELLAVRNGTLRRVGWGRERHRWFISTEVTDGGVKVDVAQVLFGDS